jgi:hypothetical protein
METLQKLTSSEIEDVVKSFPEVKALTSKIGNKVKEQIQKVIRRQLGDDKLTLVTGEKRKEAIALLKKMIIQQHYNSLIHPGEPVGIRAAEAIGQPVTQMALNSFHSAGSSANVSGGIEGIRELYNMSQERKNENTIIHFKNKYLTFEKAIDIRRELVGITVKDLIKSSKMMKIDYKNIPEWYELYKDIYGKTVPKNTNDFLRLEFDKTKMFNFNVSIEEIVESMEEQGVICIASPSYQHTIDIYPETDIILEKLKKDRDIPDTVKSGLGLENAPSIFLQFFFQPLLNEKIVHGIKGITNILPIDSNTIAIVKYEDKIQGKPRQWKIGIDKLIRLTEGIPLDKLEGLFVECGIKIIENKVETDNCYIIEMPLSVPLNLVEDDIVYEDDFVEKLNGPTDYINKLCKSDKDYRKKKNKSLKEQGIYLPEEETVLSIYGTYIKAISNGTNLNKVLSNEYIDPTRTISSNPHEMLKTLGIEATRNFLIREYDRIFKDNYVNPKHITLAVDFQTSLGVLLPITARGIARQKTGPLARASFDDPLKVFVETSAFGSYEEIKSTSTSIFVGKRMIIGTGSFGSRLDIKMLEAADKMKEARLEELRRKCVEEQTVSPECDNLLDENILTSRETKALVEKGLDVGDLDFTKDGINEIIGLDSLVNIERGKEKIAKLKIKTDVPQASKIRATPPIYLSLTLYETLFPNPISSRSKSPVRKSVSKPGLPALPDLKVSQFLALNPIKTVITTKKDNLKTDFLNF